MPLAIPVQQEVAELLRELDAPIPKELCFPSLEGGYVRQLE